MKSIKEEVFKWNAYRKSHIAYRNSQLATRNSQLPSPALTLFVIALLIAPVAISAAPSTSRVRHVGEPVPGLYLISLRGVAPTDVRPVATHLVGRAGGILRLVFQHASTGFSAQLTEAQAAAISTDPLVDLVEEVAVVHDSSSQNPPTGLPLDNSLWHLDRIDQPSANLDHQYYYCEQGGGVYAYLIGSGVYRDHDEFKRPDGTSRVVRGAKFAADDCIAPNDAADYGYWPCGTGTSDGNFTGHDTACASVLGGKTYGVAKTVTIVPIRIRTAAGYSQTEWMNYAIDWIMNPSANPYYYNRPAVVSISSFYFTQSSTDPGVSTAASYLENEINKLVGHPYDPALGTCRLPYAGEWPGVPVTVSANNQHTDQSYTTPARMAHSNTSFATCGHVISVGGTDEADHLWVCGSGETCGGYATWDAPNVTKPRPFQNPPDPPTGSNYGPTVDIYAPAHRLKLAAIQSANAVVEDEGLRSGTSYAAPIVAGVITRLQQAVGALSEDAAWAWIRDNASHAPVAFDATGNDRIVHRDGAPVCNPEYP